MEIREATYSDLVSIEAVTAAAFGEEPDGRVVTMMRALAASGASRVSLVALVEETIVGHVGLSRGWIDARTELVDVLVLSPLSVLPDVQGRGIGSALVAAALGAAGDHGAPALFLEGAWDFYGARGFSPGGSLGFERPSTRIPEQAFQVALLPRHEPWMVGRLIYPEVFWATDTVGGFATRGSLGSRTCRSTPPTRAASRLDRRMRRPTCRAPPGPAVASVRPGRRWPGCSSRCGRAAPRCVATNHRRRRRSRHVGARAP